MTTSFFSSNYPHKGNQYNLHYSYSQANATTDVNAIAKKSKNVQKALEEMQKREEQLKRLHDKEQQGRESGALKRKEEMEQKIRDKILSANRYNRELSRPIK